MRILGIDPGSINCGYGLIEKANLKEIVYLSSGRITVSPKEELPYRIREIFTSLLGIISEHRPDEMVVEKIFFAKGTKSALNLGYIRGVVLLSAALAKIPIYEYSALEVKKAVVGYGKADKSQVKKMVKEILKIDHMLSQDSADAIALALCHANQRMFLINRNSFV
ncbi:MAG: crossover junction endodeoxyribonuclease RuvC [Thermodesulfovibrionales bacterium]|nr:crossover junction endodeoxyribonuclease RuvC [Thermodesulfovibrionales bacterium]